MPVLAFEVIRSSGAFPPSWPRHAYRQSPPGFALRIVRRLHCDPSRNALRNPSLKRLGENRRLIVYGDIGMCKETDTRPFAHPYVRSKRPSLRPDLLSLAQGGGRRSRRAAGHRKAARSVLEGHPPSCDALARGVGVRSRFRFPRSLHASGSARGKHINKRGANPVNHRRHAQPGMDRDPQATARLNQRLSTELKFRTRLYQSR
jgi:hypothetical protein